MMNVIRNKIFQNIFKCSSTRRILENNFEIGYRVNNSGIFSRTCVSVGVTADSTDYRNKINRIIENYDTILLDLDGTLWGMDHYSSLPGIPATIDFLRKLGKKLLFVTNNSFHSNSHYLKKFKQHGFEADVDDVFGVAYASALYLKCIAKITGQVYVLGTQGMEEELDNFGIKHFGIGRDPDLSSLNVDDLLKMEFRENVEAVLMGFDKDFHYNKIFKAASYLTDPKCHYVATNDVEVSLIIGKNRMQPTTGSLIQAVSAAARRKPHVIGKPHSLMFDCLLEKHPDIDKKRCLFVGDSLKADIRFANNIGIDSAFVLTGANSTKDFKEYPDAHPTFVLSSFADVCV